MMLDFLILRFRQTVHQIECRLIGRKLNQEYFQQEIEMLRMRINENNI